MGERRAQMQQSTLPPELAGIAQSIQHPDVVATQVVSTAEGGWAILAKLRSGAAAPIPEVEQQASGFPVVYEPDRGVTMVARPAYPSRGE